jgi:signal transduction histidine kinase
VTETSIDIPFSISGGVKPSSPALSPGDLAELLGAFNDVTSRLQSTHERLHAEVARLTEELRRANEEIERSRRLAALGEMAAGIAHEVRNPLASIRLYARMLGDDLADRPAERATVVKIDSAAKGLSAIVDDLLMFAREFKPRAEFVSAGDLIESAVSACREELVPGFDAVEIRFDVDPEANVSADRALACRALVNVVRNAVEAMVEAGSPTRRLTLRASVDGDSQDVAIDVTDTGPGVPPEVVARMFNPFFTTRAHGTGLGLAIVHRIVEAHGGRVRVEAVTDGPSGRVNGTRVRLSIPSAGRQASGFDAAESSAKSVRGSRESASLALGLIEPRAGVPHAAGSERTS